MNNMSYGKWFALIVMTVLGTLTTSVLSATFPTLFSNTDSIVNTRHNMTQSSIPAQHQTKMDVNRNDYGEVCVYCHTPHGSQNLVNMPLWNRTVNATTTYTTYNSFSLTQGTAPQPGNNSLTCLTCHDGQTAIDSIINMPGSGMGQASQATSESATFLNAWNNPVGRTDTPNHAGLNSNLTSAGGKSIGGILFLGQTVDIGCMGCHSPDNSFTGNASGPDFSMYVIGTDLTNDHPVGINFPAASGVGSGFNLPAGIKGTARYFDNNSNGHMDTNEVRLYGTSGTIRVECASCHDPHGVPSAGAGSVFKPTFLRVANGDATGSALCLTCHDK